MDENWANQPDALKAIWTPDLDPLFWRSDRIGVHSAWYGHVPFAHWLVRALAPRCIVELGTHNGVSYAAFCRAVQREGLGTQCFAVDTWKGDDHAGLYGEEVFQGLRAYHDERFGAFSTLVRRTFDDALALVTDGSVDLLHIDGRHGFNDVRHDFDSWRCKLSDSAVVLLHDTNVRENEFGVWQLWAELQTKFPAFEFLHAHGLGVLAVGRACPPMLAALTGLRSTAEIGAVRERFAQLGERSMFEAQVRLLVQTGAEQALQHRTEAEALAARLQAAQVEEIKAVRAHGQDVAARLEAELHEAVAARGAAEAKADEAGREVARTTQTLALLEAAHGHTNTALTQAARDHQVILRREQGQASSVRAARTEAAAAQMEMAQQRAATAALAAAHQREAERRAEAEAALDRFVQSNFWRATRPLRTGLSHMPSGLRRAVHGAVKTVWRSVTPHLNEQRHSLRLLPPPAVHALPAPAGAVPAATDSAGRPRAGPLVCYVSGEPDTPGTIYRVDRYADACRMAGAEVTVLRLDQLATHVQEAGKFDVVVIWRAVWTVLLAAFVIAARAGGARIVFDIDDLMIDPALGTVEVIDGIRSQNVSETAVQAHYAEVQHTMLMADYTTASTDELVGHMRRFGKVGFTLPNGFDLETLQVSRMAARRRQVTPPDGVLRLGYASGSRTHQKDFAELAAALPAVLRANADYRLVLFQAGPDVKLVDLREFPELEPFAGQIEWRELVPLARLPEEIARFDVNLAPLQLDNLFCEAKSELKFFEGALAGVCTVASPVGPYARAIRHGVNGFIAATREQWEATLIRLLGDAALRQQVAQVALNDVLWSYGPERRVQSMRRMLAQWQGDAAVADAFVLELRSTEAQHRSVEVPGGEVAFSQDQLRPSQVTVAIPLHNYAHMIVETLESVRAQTLQALDLVIVDDCSADASLSVAVDWVRRHADRFNRVQVLHNYANAGLGWTRNAAFAAAETPYVLPLDADNLLRPGCCELLLEALVHSGAAYAYPVIQEFGARDGLMGTAPYDPARLVGGNYIDAMAMVSKAAWSAVGGYGQLRLGWEDYDFWCALAERGLAGHAMGGPPLADYRAHSGSMLAHTTDVQDTKRRVIATIEARHPWVSVARPLRPRAAEPSSGEGEGLGLERLLPILRCPDTGGRLHRDGQGLRSDDGSRLWPIKAGRPILFPGVEPEAVKVFSHLSNEVPESALALIQAAKGLVLNLSAGGTAVKHDHVIEAEAAIFGNTDLVADSHRLPFADESFAVVIAMNAFEHYRDPPRAAAEIRRVLQPGGQVLIRTAFLQPQHEPPHHFYNATRFGVAEWFAGFETERLHVSDNFNPAYALAWMAHECEQAMRHDGGAAAAAALSNETIGGFARFWTQPAAREHAVWQSFSRLSQPSQEVIAAGFEYLGRRS